MRDIEMASISKRVLKDGSVRWLGQIRKKGFKTVSAWKMTKKALEAEVRRIELAMDSGTWDEFARSEQKDGNTSLAHFIRKYLKEITPHKTGGQKTIINESTALNQVLDTPISTMDIYQIKKGHVIELRNTWRDKGNRPSTINRKLTTLHDVFKHIQTTWLHENLVNPVMGSKMPIKGGAGERSRALSDSELRRLREALDGCHSPYPRWLFELALQTAGRRRELLENTWQNINMGDKYLVIPEELSKTRKKRLVPLTTKALQILEEMHKVKESPDLFPITTKAFEEAWKKAMRRSEIKDFQFRDTRHMASTMLSNIYPKMQDLAKITGHDKLDTLLIYYEESITEQVQTMQNFCTMQKTVDLKSEQEDHKFWETNDSTHYVDSKQTA
ncbi:MAG: site-specific integrase [Ghiorsea sp.]|nr:site-specific integrase [Ghiorsea sp.]